MDGWTKKVWQARQYGYSWKEISTWLGVTEHQAKMKFQYGLEKTRANILRSLKAAWVKKPGWGLLDVYLLCCWWREANLNARGYSAADEKRILDVLGRGLLKEFPNPERSGCPDSDVLKRIAHKTMHLTEAEKWLDHLGSCSPCYKDFSELRKVREVQRRRTLLAIAASILVAVGIAGRVLIRRHNEPLVAPTAVVDLRNSSVSRSPELNPEEKPLELRRGFAQLNIYLPLGTPEGVYEVRIVSISGDLLLKAGGTAEVKDGVTALEVKVNVFVASPGQYNLQIRKPPSEWSSYPLVLR
jgi:hypothetical protein